MSPIKHIPSLCLLIVAMLALSTVPVRAGEQQLKIAGYTPAEALRLGERMYLRGILPDGTPMRAVVQGDLEVTGTMTTCANCHQRSGMGSLEGGVVTPPTTGAKLFAPLRGPQDIPGTIMKRSMATIPPRPAYSDETLVKALVEGVDPKGRHFSVTMPRYLLDDASAKVLVFYLRNLSSRFSAGVTDEEIRFATIVTAETPAVDREAMLQPLRAFLKEEWNDRLSDFNSPWNPWNVSVVKASGKLYRRAVLDVWELKGGHETWGTQLEAFYRARPVFALVGGLAPGKWEPIHDFCEKNRIPCIMPITDLPVISGDWYTLYFSRGFHQEGEAAASYLSRVIDLPADRQVVQVHRTTSQSEALARGFADTWKSLGDSALTSVAIPEGQTAGAEFWNRLAAQYPGAVLLAWLDQADMPGLASLVASENRPTTIFVSASLLGGALASLPDAIRDRTFITYPRRLPGEEEYTTSIVSNWMRMKKLPLNNMAISSKMYSATRLLAFALADMGVDFYRDFFMDLIDDGIDQPHSSITYPLLSFGPGQRYASKGCYVVTLTRGENPKIVRQSDWIIY